MSWTDHSKSPASTPKRPTPTQKAPQHVDSDQVVGAIEHVKRTKKQERPCDQEEKPGNAEEEDWAFLRDQANDRVDDVESVAHGALARIANTVITITIPLL